MQTVKGPFYLYLLMWEINELPLRAEKLNTCDAKMGNGIEKRLEKWKNLDRIRIDYKG